MVEVHRKSAEFGEESSTAAPTNENKIVLVTVHGTGAGHENASGDRWWQLGSTFLVELGKRLELDPERVEIAPFQWEEGPNSETERRVAGRKLYEKLLAYDITGKDYYLICHSHGGSVAYSALLQSLADSGPLKGLKCWCTVGTPFLDYCPNRWLPQRLHSLGLTFFAAGICSIILGFCVGANLLRYGPEAELSELGMALILYGAICIAGLFLYERRFRKKSWFTLEQKKETASLYSKSWYGLWHKEDEAISALSNIKKVNAPIVPTKFLLPTISIGQLMVVALVGILLAVDIVFDDAYDLLQFLDPDEEVEGDIDAIFLLIIFTITSAVLFVAAGLISIVLKFLAAQIGKPLSGILNKVIWSSVRQRAWGDDLVKEDVKAIRAHPPEFADKFGPLPNAIEDPMRKYSSKYAIETLERVREVLGMKPGSSTTPDLRSQLTENLKWKELIHTSYFEVSEFIDLLALALHKTGMAKLRNEFTIASEREMLGNWLETTSKS